MASRDKEKLHPELKKRWEYLKDNWQRDDREPFLTATYRDDEEQRMLYENGKTNAQPGESLHNYQPALAFDFAFRKPDGTVDWSWQLYEKFGKEGEKLGLTWGGRWEGLKDGTHLQMPMTYKDAKAGEVPTLPTLNQDEKLTELLDDLDQLLEILKNKIRE